MNRRDSLRWTIGMLALGHLSAARSHTGVTVGVRQVPRADGSMQYAYHLDNGGSQPVVALLLGHNHPHGVSELTTYPRGWTPGSAAGTASPPGWRVEVITTEDNGYAEIEWRSKVAMCGPASVWTVSLWCWTSRTTRTRTGAGRPSWPTAARRPAS